MPLTEPPLLRFARVSKRFGGTQAVDDVSVDVHAGEILALLGENGAGKSTLIKLLAGIHAADSGEISCLGEPQRVWRGRPRAHWPVAFIHQDLGLVDWMTVAENVVMAIAYPRWFGWRWGPVDWSRADRLARSVLARAGCELDPRRRVFSLTRAEKSLLCIARALAVQARILVLDEPTASLPAPDVERLFGVLRGLRDRGVGMIYVTHRLDEVMRLADRAAVMRDGRLVAVERMATTSESELVERIVGRALRPSAPQRPPAEVWVDTPLLSMTGVIAGNAGPVDLALHRGEILGLVGLRGAGQEAVGRAMFGCEPRLAGQIRVAGRALPLRAPAEAIAAGIGFCAAERLELNLAGAMSVQENLFPNPGLHGEPLLDFARRRRERLRAGEWLERLEVSPRAPQAVVHTLSGGNQQKVVLARWESLALPVQILEEPTAGVDVGAKQQIYARLRVRAESGAGLVIVSTDFDEIAHLCSRVLVFRAGRIVAELRGADVCVPRLLSLAAGTLAAERHAA